MTRGRSSGGILLDANLLVLLVAGATDRSLVGKHKRLRDYHVKDYDLLVSMLNPYDHVLVTPNVLTEASNLASQHGDPERSRILGALRTVIREGKEVVVSSRTASDNAAFPKLGLTDAALLEVVSAETPLLTVDLQLYLAACKKGEEAAVNFRHYQFPDL